MVRRMHLQMGGGAVVNKLPIAQRRAKLLERFPSTELDRANYLIEWTLSERVPRFIKCSDCRSRDFKRLPKRRTRHGVFCLEHYVNHPRCTVAGCDNLADIDPYANPDMLCRDHLFPDDDEPTPTWTRSMIADAELR